MKVGEDEGKKEILQMCLGTDTMIPSQQGLKGFLTARSSGKQRPGRHVRGLFVLFLSLNLTVAHGLELGLKRCSGSIQQWGRCGPALAGLCHILHLGVGRDARTPTM